MSSFSLTIDTLICAVSEMSNQGKGMPSNDLAHKQMS